MGEEKNKSSSNSLGMMERSYNISWPPVDCHNGSYLSHTALDDVWICSNGSGNMTTTDFVGHYFYNNTATDNTTEWINSTRAEDNLIFTSLTSAVLGVLILATIIGNVFVIAAILLERHLHSVANYLIVSLAVADLLVACLVMPLGAVYEISQRWILGPELCDMWTSSDVLCCTASILHLVAIATDRYWAVTNLDYIHNRNFSRIGTMIFLVWAVALVVSVAPLFGWKDAEFLDRVNIQQRCLISQDVSYQIFATCATFYVPLAVILIVYWKIFQTARRRIRKRTNQQQLEHNQRGDTGESRRRKFMDCSWFRCSSSSSAEESEHIKDDEPPARTSSDDVTGGAILVVAAPDSTAGSPGNSRQGDEGQQTTAFTIDIPPTAASVIDETVTKTCNGAESSSLAVPVKPSIMTVSKSVKTTENALNVRKKRETLEAKRERKAAKTLAIITGAFVVCWLPFFVCALLMPLRPDWVFDETMLSVFLWLGYFNSTLNPIIYTIFSPEFRQAFKRLLCGKSAVNGTSAYRPRKLR